jgi:hypothetical protein
MDVRIHTIFFFEEFVSNNSDNHKGHEVPRRKSSGGSFVNLRVLRGKCSFLPATGEPPKLHNVRMTVRRLKTYTGGQGYVYQYYFVGKRTALPDDAEAPATEFIFDVTSDRKLTYSVSVFLPQGPLAEWSQNHGRALNDAEQYAAVKLRLFRAFDELEDVKADGRRLRIDSALLEEALSTLGVE